jgi:hypothetical protein
MVLMSMKLFSFHNQLVPDLPSFSRDRLVEVQQHSGDQRVTGPSAVGTPSALVSAMISSAFN